MTWTTALILGSCPLLFCAVRYLMSLFAHALRSALLRWARLSSPSSPYSSFIPHLSALFLLVLFLLPPSSFLLAEIPEPETVFYGKVVNKSDGHEYQLSSGALSWTLSSEETGSTSVTLTADLESLDDGNYSYRLNVPHETLVQVTTASDGVVPLTEEAERYMHSAITVDGATARIVAPAKDFIEVEELTRALTYRIDLEVTLEAPDTDDDGMPDWWEELYNLNKYVDDSTSDPDDDGVINLDEYTGGMDPNTSNQAPTLATTDITAYESGTVGIVLRTLDCNSAAAQLTYTLDTIPTGGTFYLAAVPLGANDTFTQAQVNAGQLTFVHTDTSVTETSFDVTVRDEQPTSDSGTVTVSVCQPTATDGGDALLWLDAAALAGTSDGAALAAWPDRSGNGNDAAQTEEADRPLFDEDAGDGRAAVQFGGEHRYFDMTAGSFADSAHTAFVLHNAPATTDEQTFLMNANMELAITGSSNSLGHDSEVRYTASLLNQHSNVSVTDDWHLTASVVSTSARTLYQDGAWAATGTDSSASARLAPQPALGVYKKKWTQGGTSTFDYLNPLVGSLREVLVFDRALDVSRRQQVEDYLKSKWFGAIVWDASDDSFPLDQTGTASADIMIGGVGSDILYAGEGDDILRGGPGNDELHGGAGNDIFVINSADDGHDRIADFALDRTRSVGEQDVVDLSALFSAAGTNLRDYLVLTTDGVDTVIGIDLDGDGSGYTDVTVTLAGETLTNDDLPWLLADGIILTGAMRLPLEITVATSTGTAVEIDGTEAAFAVSVTGGGLKTGQILPFTMSGAAAQGVDYTLEARVYNRETSVYERVSVTDRVELSLASGDSVLTIYVVPVADAETEGLEELPMTLLAKPGVYDLGAAVTATAGVEDGMPTVTIEATIASADEEGPTDGEFTITRTGPTDASLQVLASIQGSAINGNDYQLISSPLTIPAGESSLVVAVHPFADTLSESLEEVVIALLPGTGYKVGADNQATVTIRDEIPRVSIEALSPVARVAGPVPGVFLVSRTGLLTGSLFVRLSVGGSAINGTDYEYISPYVMLASNEAYATIEVTPLAGASIQGTEDVVISITEHADYALGTQTQATVTFDASNEAPTLTPATSAMIGIDEDNTTNNGMSVANIVGGSITDNDAGALEGVAVFGTASGNGSWQFSLDGGASWASVGDVSQTDALLLRPTDRVRFVPNTENGTVASISYHAWDQTDGGVPGTKADVQEHGGETAFSTASDTASITVSSANDAPVVANEIPDQTASENSVFEFIFAADAFNDVDTGDTLSYGATQADDSSLPGWLTFVPVERRFHGTPQSGDAGNISIKVVATDDAVSPLSVSDTFELAVQPDNPSVVIALATGQSLYSATVPINLEIRFSESVTGLLESEIAVSGTATVTAQTFSGSGADYSLSFTGISEDGTITVSIPAEAAVDGAGNGNLASDPLTVVFDTTAPEAPAIVSPEDDSTENTASPVISGTAEPSGSPVGDIITVEVFSDVDDSLGTTEVNDDGTWSLTPSSAMSGGTHTLTARATDVAGNTGLFSLGTTVHIHLDPFAAPLQSDRACYVYGVVELDGEAVPEGWIVAVFSARDATVPCGKGTVDETGAYGSIPVAGYDNIDDRLPRAGDELFFEVWNPLTGTVYAARTDPAAPTWTADKDVNEVNLTLGGLELALNAGWNLIGWNVNQCWFAGASAADEPLCSVVPDQPREYVGSDVISAASILQQIDGNYTRITGFDAEGGHLFDVANPGIGNLKYLAGGYGYWIYMSGADTLFFEGSRVPADTQFDLSAGWQLLTNWTGTCYYVSGKVDPDTLTLPTGVAKKAVTSIGDIFGSPSFRIRITGYHDQNATLFDSQLPDGANSLHYLSPGYGYWIYCENGLAGFSWPAE